MQESRSQTTSFATFTAIERTFLCPEMWKMRRLRNRNDHLVTSLCWVTFIMRVMYIKLTTCLSTETSLWQLCVSFGVLKQCFKCWSSSRGDAATCNLQLAFFESRSGLVRSFCPRSQGAAFVADCRVRCAMIELGSHLLQLTLLLRLYLGLNVCLTFVLFLFDGLFHFLLSFLP